MFSPEDYFDLKQTEHAALFQDVDHAWEVLSKIADYLQKNLKPANRGEVLGKSYIGEQVYIGANTIIEPSVTIMGPAWIGSDCTIRQGAYIRENVITGNACVLGNSCEFKNSILFNDVQVPHFSYVGDSILGHKAHLGAGVILSNLKLDRSPIQIWHDGQIIDTGLKKFGAIIGDACEIGTNCVINPGSILGQNSIIYPLTSWKGVLPANSIVKSSTEYKVIPRRKL